MCEGTQPVFLGRKASSLPGLYAFSSQLKADSGCGRLTQLSLGANQLGSKGAQLAAELAMKMKLERHLGWSRSAMTGTYWDCETHFLGWQKLRLRFGDQWTPRWGMSDPFAEGAMGFSHRTLRLDGLGDFVVGFETHLWRLKKAQLRPYRRHTSFAF